MAKSQSPHRQRRKATRDGMPRVLDSSATGPVRLDQRGSAGRPRLLPVPGEHARPRRHRARGGVSGLPAIFAGLLRLRAGPQDLPYSWTLTAFVLAIYLAEGMYTGYLLDDGNASLKSLAISALQFFAVTVMVYLRSYPERLAQTLCALAGTGFILGLLAFLFAMQADPDRNQPLLALVWLAIFAWSLAVDANIYRHALSVTMPQGVLVAVLLLAASYLLIEAAF
jgi:hypothetical protein